jgi:hypothetical protein
MGPLLEYLVLLINTLYLSSLQHSYLLTQTACHWLDIGCKSEYLILARGPLQRGMQWKEPDNLINKVESKFIESLTSALCQRQLVLSFDKLDDIAHPRITLLD